MKPVPFCLWLAALVLPGNAGEPARKVPELMIGRFIDDYGITHVITDTSWTLGGRDRYHIVFSADNAQYLIARNDSMNMSDPGKWSRIDWTLLSNMPLYDWAFCLIEYKARSRAEAEANISADHEHPRTGCNGFPFSRMRRGADDSTSGY